MGVEGYDEHATPIWSQKRNQYFQQIRTKKKKPWVEYIVQAFNKEMWGVWKMASTNVPPRHLP